MEDQNKVPVATDNSIKLGIVPPIPRNPDIQVENDKVNSLQNRIAFVPKFDNQADSPEDVNLRRIPLPLKKIIVNPTYFVNKDDNVTIFINGERCDFTRFIDKKRAFDRSNVCFYTNTENRYYYKF